MKTPTTIYPSTNLPTRAWRHMRLVFRRLQDDAAKLFSYLWKSPPECIHNKTAAIRSELGHDAVRRYYWVCSKCGERVYTTIGQEMPTVFSEHRVPSYLSVIAAAHEARESDIRRILAGMKNV